MKRYSHAAYPNSHRLDENPTGEWVRWEDVEELDRTNTLNFETLDIMFQHILTSDLVQDDDIGEGNTPEAIAQAYIRVYDRLVKERDSMSEALRKAIQKIDNLNVRVLDLESAHTDSPWGRP